MLAIDVTDRKILALLHADGRKSWKEIGAKLGITGQAVSARVQLLEHRGIIAGYTIKRGKLHRNFITVFMNDGRFDDLEKFLVAEPAVEEAYKVAGEGCYQLVLASEQPEALDSFLERLSKFARYRVSAAMRCVKS